MSKNLRFISKDGQRETQQIELELEGRKKLVTIRDYGNETENLRATCRALKSFEDELQIR